jgi:5-methylcytosine-specific restriction enzyme subunit McrC
VEQLQTTTRDANTQSILADLSAWFHPVTLLPQVTPEFLDSIQFNRLNERFRPAFNLASMFLSGSAIQLRAGSQAACAFVFDMNVLFERFVAGFLNRYRHKILPAEWQDITILPQSAGAAWYLGRSEGKNLLRLRPDLLLMRKDRPAPLLVIDTKYKRLAPAHRKTGASPEDIYQVLAYAIRLQCPLGLLLYPQAAGSSIQKEIVIDSAGLRLLIATMNLRAPLEQPDFLITELHNIFKITA